MVESTRQEHGQVQKDCEPAKRQSLERAIESERASGNWNWMVEEELR